MQSSRLRNLFLGGGRPQLFRAILSIASSKKAPRGPRSRQKQSKKPEFCLPHPPKRPRVAPEVDKNREKCRNFVYRCLQGGPARPPKPRRLRQLSYWEVLPKSACTRPIFTAPYPNAASHHRCIQKHWILQKRTAENRTVLEMCRIYLFLSY